MPYTSLKPYNTFGIDAKAKHFITIEKPDDLYPLARMEQPLFLLGGGSNVLFVSDTIEDRAVVKINLKGIEVAAENETSVWVRASGGEDWDVFVADCVQKGYGGLENLSLIPGTVGACPIQNIGAYGVSASDVITEVAVFCLQTQTFQKMTPVACDFGYRDSIFKRAFKGDKIIVAVTFKLTKATHHQVNIAYKSLQAWFTDKPTAPNMASVREAVIAIRQSKLPDPAILGNAGSFFKNPILPKPTFKKLAKVHPEMPSYPVPQKDGVKVAAAWLIQKAGWKGKRIGNCGVHQKQALVLVNYGGASGQEIHALAQQIQASVQARFGVDLQMEVNRVG